MNAEMANGRLPVRTVWLSDIHLGSKDCRAHYLLDFLQRVECDTLYLLGDIVDFWALRRKFIWPAAHYDVLRLIMRKAQSGTRVVYVPGNHDEAMREFVGHHFRSRRNSAGNQSRHCRWASSVAVSWRRTRRACATRFYLASYRRCRVRFSDVDAPLGRARAARVRSAVLVAVQLCKSAQWQMRARRSPHSKTPHCRKRNGAGSMVSSAGIFIIRKLFCAMGWSIATTATGWRAALRWSRTRTARWRFCTGRITTNR